MTQPTGQIAESVDDYVRKHPQLGQYGAQSPLFEAALRLTGEPDGLIVDIGCGEGRTLMSLRRWGVSTEVLGIDLSIHRAVIATRRGFRAIVADGHDLPLEDKSASLVICRHVIEHVDDDVRSLVEMSRILSERGLLYLETPLKQTGAWYFYRNFRRDWVLDPTHQREYRSVSELEEVCARAELVPISVDLQPITFPIRHIAHRILRGNRPPDQRTAQSLERSRIALRVPRYKEIQLLARRRRPNDPRSTREALAALR